MYIRKEIYQIDELLSLVKMWYSKKDIAIFDGDEIKLGSQRYKLFKSKGVICVTCGLEGKYFAKERDINTQSWHMNLYGIDKQGNEVMLTKDHIKPKALEGKNNLSNYQVMCSVCNHEKGKKY